MKRILSIVLAIAFYPAMALAEFDIGTGGSTGFLGQLTRFMQEAVNWATGPLGLAAVGVAVLAAVIAWNRAPQQSEAVGKSVRALLSAIVVLGFGAFMTWLASYA